MMRLPALELAAPETLAEAVALLGGFGPQAHVLGGGTDLVPALKRREIALGRLISTRKITDLQGIRELPDGLHVGAATTLAELAACPPVVRDYPALAAAASAVATPQVRQAATLGGNACLDTRCSYYNQTETYRAVPGPCLKAGGDRCHVAPGSARCWAVCSADTAPVLCALDARFHLVGPAGERIVAARDFYRADGLIPLAKDRAEILVSIQLPPPHGLRSAYLKLRRRGSIDFPALGVAVALRLACGNVIAARVVLGAVAPAPLDVTGAGQALVGGPLTPAKEARAAELAFAAARPLDNTDFPPSYRKRMARILTARALDCVRDIESSSLP